MADSGWDPRQMFDRYLYDYLLRKKMHTTARIFKEEAKVSDDRLGINSPEGFLWEWWSFFYDVYSSRDQKDHVANKQPSVELFEMNRKMVVQLPYDVDFANMVGGPHASMLAKMYEEDHIGHPSSKILDPRIQMVNGKPTVKVPGHPRQQIHAENQQRVTDNRQRIYVNKSIPLESTPHGVPKAMLPRTGPHDTVLKKRSCPLPLDGRPLTGIDQIPPGLGKQVLKSVPHMPIQQQCFQMLRAQSQQELVAQALQHTPQNLMSSFSGNFADMDPQTLMLLKVGLNRNDGPGTGNFGLQHIGSSPVEALSRMGKTAPTTESGRKKKGRLGCQAEDVTAAGYPAGSAESVLPIYVNMEREALSHSDRASEKQNIRGSNKSGLVEAFEKMGAMDGQDDASSDTYVESFLSYDNETEDMKNDPFSTLQRSSTTCGKNAPKDNPSNSQTYWTHGTSDVIRFPSGEGRPSVLM